MQTKLICTTKDPSRPERECHTSCFSSLDYFHDSIWTLSSFIRESIFWPAHYLQNSQSRHYPILPPPVPVVAAADYGDCAANIPQCRLRPKLLLRTRPSTARHQVILTSFPPFHTHTHNSPPDARYCHTLFYLTHRKFLIAHSPNISIFPTQPIISTLPSGKVRQFSTSPLRNPSRNVSRYIRSYTFLEWVHQYARARFESARATCLLD